MKQQNPVLNPTLQGVLSCLDVQLEAELIRYRRQKAKARSQSAKGKANPLAALDLKAFNAQPLREPITPGFALTQAIPQAIPQGVPVRHPELDRPGDFAPLSVSQSPVNGTSGINGSSDPAQPSLNQLNQPFAPVSAPQPLEVHHLQHSQVSISPAAEELIALEGVDSYSEDLHSVDAYSEDLHSADAYSEGLYSEDRPSEQPSIPQEENPYVIMTEPYTPTPVNWAESSIADEPTVLELPLSDASDSSIAIEEADTVLTSLVLPAELSETELVALAGLSSLAIVSEGNHEEKDWPEYEISDEDNPWPDDLDEEPYALDTAFAGELAGQEVFGLGADGLGTDGLGTNIVEFPIDDEIVPPAAIDSPLTDPEFLLESGVESDLESVALPREETDPLMLPSAEHRHPNAPLVPPSSYPGPHHLKPVGVLGAQMLRPQMDYLASSEALLDNLDEEDDRQNWPQRLSNLFTPQGMGSALLLIFSALAVSMVLLNPELVSHWKLGRSAPESAPQTPPDVVIQESPVEGPNPNPYNVSSQEFLNLDLGNLSKVKPQPSPNVSATTPGLTPLSPAPVNGLTPTPSESTASSSEMFSDLRDSVTGSDSGNSSENSTETVSQTSEPIRPRVAAPVAEPLPRTAPTIAEPEAPPVNSAPRQEQSAGNASESSAGGSYVVAIPYTSDQLLDQSQAIVPDAYLKNTDQGANIQFGVFSDPESAAALAEQLQEQGIAVEVIPADP